MEDYPKVSIIIPTYNRSAYLVQAIESALMQDYHNLDVIVSDDASTDSTENVVKEYINDKRFRYYRNSDNLGASLNIRRLLYEYVDADWFLLMSDDDYLIDSHYISKAVGISKKDKGIVLIHANCGHFYMDKNIIQYTNNKFPEIKDGKWYFLNWAEHCAIYPITTLWKTSIARQLKCFYSDCYASDWESTLKMCLEGSVGFIKAKVGIFRVHSFNLSSNLSIDTVLDAIPVCIYGPYRYAKEVKAFPDSTIRGWIERKIKIYLKITFANKTHNDFLYSRLFVKTDNKHSEKDLIRQKFDYNAGKIMIGLAGFKTIKGLKLYPLNKNCIIKIDDVFLKDNLGAEYRLEPTVNNAKIVVDDTFYFLNEEPQIDFDLNGIGFKGAISSFVCNIKYLSINEEDIVYEYLKQTQGLKITGNNQYKTQDKQTVNKNELLFRCRRHIEKYEQIPIKIPEHYNYIGIFLTQACNLSCSYCINLNERGLSRSKIAKKHHISGEEWTRFINRLQIKPKGLPVTLQGGEPTLHKDFYEIISQVRSDIKLDLLTNFMFDIDEFILKVKPEVFARKAKYAAIRVSYHPGQNDIDELIKKTIKMADAGFYIGLYSVMTPENEFHIKEIQNKCLNLGIDFRIKEYLGYLDGKWYGTYKYPEAITQNHGKYCECKTTELIAGPDGNIYRCHSDLYSSRNPICSISDPNFQIEDIRRPCYVFGHCNPCDIKIKTNRFQEFGHSSVDIINMRELTESEKSKL